MPTLHVSSLHSYYLINGEIKGTIEFNQQPTWNEMFQRLGFDTDTPMYGSTMEETVDFKDKTSKIPYNMELLIISPYASASKYVYTIFLLN